MAASLSRYSRPGIREPHADLMEGMIGRGTRHVRTVSSRPPGYGMVSVRKPFFGWFTNAK